MKNALVRTSLGRQHSRGDRWLIGVELALVASVFVADRYHHIFFSKTLYLLALGWLSLILRDQRWRDLGLSAPMNWRRLVFTGLCVGVVMELLELFATQPALILITGQNPDLSDLHGIVGNVPMLVVAVAASWLLAGVGEELVWRGYLLNRLADLFGGNRLGWSMSIGMVSLAFGLAHSYQGITGIIENSVDGAFLAILYVACGRNLIAPIVAHGVTDTLDSLMIFAGIYPGMR